MKFFIAVMAVVCLSSKAMGGGDSASVDGSFEDTKRGYCYCQPPYRNRGGSCAGNPIGALFTLGCPNTNSFLQCSGQTCSVQACPPGQVWNKLANACAACATGFHVSADLQVCVCNTGTTPNRQTGGCSPCPSAATVEADRCYCPLGLVLDRVNNACKACPVGTSFSREGKCQCAFTTPQLYFSATTWTCQPCPGTVITQAKRGGRVSEQCSCTGAGQIFDRNTVTCYTCPAGITTPDRDGDECLCSLRLQKFDMASQQCVCAKGYVVDPVSGGCVWSPVVPGVPVATTTRAPLNP